MAETRRATRDLHKYFKLRRVETEQGSYIKRRYKEGTQILEMQGIQRDNEPWIMETVNRINFEHIDKTT
ncbi:hypothetical protein ACJMK2_018284 [Sinanodonta woodiana]|uniref:Uncharacterized protein n=1 Tax=Sinanodonta woodiana TaxID=1069815 RepID=A0ABD3UCY7_SINWO